MKPALYTEVALIRDLPDAQLKQGDVAMLIDYLPHPAGGEEGAVLEIFCRWGVDRRRNRAWRRHCAAARRSSADRTLTAGCRIKEQFQKPSF